MIAVPAALAIMFETGVMPEGTMAGLKQEEFLTTVSMELLTIVAIPLALRLFKTKNVDKLQEEGNIDEVRKWTNIRTLMITLPMLANTLLYYVFLNTTFGYMSIILLICIPFIIPQKK